MARERGPLGSGSFGGAVLDTLIVKIDVDLSGLQRGIALAVAEINTLKGAIASKIGGVSLGDAMTAALVTPMIVATARIGQMRNELRALTGEMRAVAAGTAASNLPAAAAGLAIGSAPIIDAQRTGRTRGSDGRYASGWDADLSGGNRGLDALGAAGIGAAAASREDPQMRTARNLRRGTLGAAADLGAQARNAAGFGAGGVFTNWFSREGARTGDAFRAGRDNFAGFGDAADNLGMSAHSVGQAGRRAAGGRIAAMLGLVGLGSLFGDLIKLAGSLATVIAGTLAGAFAALMTPLGLVVGALTALAALFVAANWDQFVKFGEWFGDRAKTLLGEAAADIAQGWEQLKNAFDELWMVIKDALGLDDDSIVVLLQFFGEIALRVLNAVGEAIGGLLRILAEFIRMVAALLRGDWADAWTHAQGIVGQAVTAIKETFLSIFPELREAWDQFFGFVGARLNELVGSVIEAHRRIGEAFGGLFGRRQPSGSSGDDRVGGGDGGDLIGMSNSPKSLGSRGSLGGRRGSREEDRLERLGRLADDFGYRISGAFEEAVLGGRKFGDTLKSLIADLLLMVLRMAVIEPMARGIADALRGGASSGGKSGKGGVTSGILSAIGSFFGFGGFFAKGGELAPGKWGIVGENGPEIVFGGRGGASITPMGMGGGVQVDARAFIDAKGADAAAIARLQAALARRDAELPGRIRATVGDMRQRGRLAA